MKKVLSLIFCLVIMITIFTSVIDAKGSEGELLGSIENKLIRFHVIANSDSVEDQALKLKVRDKVLEYISPKLKDSKSIDESRQILKDNDENIKAVAREVIEKNGYSYVVNTTLSIENFPVKTYGNITLPQGKYEAYRILIGSGSGQNWWCVMFPPLCFVDITKGEVSYEETERRMKQVLTNDEYEAVNNRLSQDVPVDNSKKNEIIIKFKLYEILKELFK